MKTQKCWTNDHDDQEISMYILGHGVIFSTFGAYTEPKNDKMANGRSDRSREVENRTIEHSKIRESSVWSREIAS